MQPAVDTSRSQLRWRQSSSEESQAKASLSIASRDRYENVCELIVAGLFLRHQALEITYWQCAM